MELKAHIRNIPDFPKAGIQFKDITPLLGNKAALAAAVKHLAEPFRGDGVEFVVGMESRGFILGAAVAHELDAGFVPVRKPGKLPYTTERVAYELEYGEDALEIHADAFPRGAKVLVVDDLIATGGTAWATGELVKKLGGILVGYSLLIELSDLKGRQKLAGEKIVALIQYP